MQVTKVETIPIKVPFIDTLKMSIGSVDAMYHIIVKLYTDEGIVGFGEASKEYGPIFSEEYQRSIKDVIDHYLGPALIGENPFDHERILEKMDLIAKGNWFAKSAIDIALYDIIGKKLKIPVYELLGGSYREKVISACIAALMDIKKEVEKCVKFTKLGWKLIKMKVGVIESEKDIERVRAIRQAVGPNVEIAVDANGAWRADKAIRIIKKIEHYEISWVEQPVPGWDITGMAKVARAVDVPIMADESLFTPYDAINLIRNEAADAFAIKISKAGGLYNAKKIAAIAEAAHIPCYIGTMSELGIGTAAGLHFAAATRNVEFGSELRSALSNRSDDIIVETIETREGFSYVPRGIGLGVCLKDDILRKYFLKLNKTD